MHIPDGFLSGRTAAVAAVVAAAAVGTAIVQTRKLPQRRVPLLGLSAAFVFAAQMLNFPIPGGTSGHLIGGALTAILLGPSAAMLVVTAVLIVQCFLFADGGVLALGANVLNMGVIDSVAGYYIYRGVRRVIPGTQGLFAATAFASWCGAVLAAVVCSGELAISRTVPARIVLPAMVNVHMVIGLGEAIITTLVIFAVWQSRPEFISTGTAETPAPATARHSNPWEFAIYGLIIAAVMALFVSPFASKNPDGLDKVSEVLGFGEQAAKTPLLNTPLNDYKLLPGRLSETWATGLAGLIGTLVVFGLAMLLARLLVTRSKFNTGQPAPVTP